MDGSLEGPEALDRALHYRELGKRELGVEHIHRKLFRQWPRFMMFTSLAVAVMTVLVGLASLAVAGSPSPTSGSYPSTGRQNPFDMSGSYPSTGQQNPFDMSGRYPSTGQQNPFDMSGRNPTMDLQLNQPQFDPFEVFFPSGAQGVMRFVQQLTVLIAGVVFLRSQLALIRSQDAAADEPSDRCLRFDTHGKQEFQEAELAKIEGLGHQVLPVEMFRPESCCARQDVEGLLRQQRELIELPGGEGSSGNMHLTISEPSTAKVQRAKDALEEKVSSETVHFVVMASEKAAAKVHDDHDFVSEPGWLWYWLALLFPLLYLICSFFCGNKARRACCFGPCRPRVSVTWASEPADIQWQNFFTSPCSRRCRVFLALCLVALSFIPLQYLSYTKQNLQSLEKENHMPWWACTLAGPVLGLLGAIVNKAGWHVAWGLLQIMLVNDVVLVVLPSVQLARKARSLGKAGRKTATEWLDAAQKMAAPPFDFMQQYAYYGLVLHLLCCVSTLTDSWQTDTATSAMQMIGLGSPQPTDPTKIFAAAMPALCLALYFFVRDRFDDFSIQVYSLSAPISTFLDTAGLLYFLQGTAMLTGMHFLMLVLKATHLELYRIPVVLIGGLIMPLQPYAALPVAMQMHKRVTRGRHEGEGSSRGVDDCESDHMLRTSIHADDKAVQAYSQLSPCRVWERNAHHQDQEPWLWQVCGWPSDRSAAKQCWSGTAGVKLGPLEQKLSGFFGGQSLSSQRSLAVAEAVE